MECSDGAVLHEWCLDGYGLAWRSWWEVGTDIAARPACQRARRVRRAAHRDSRRFPQRRHLPLRVRLFLDFLKHTFGAPGYWG